MRRFIVITDLTRFAAGNPKICLAGIDLATGECIRPMPYLTHAECVRLGLVPGGMLSGEFIRVSGRSPPHTEDCYHDRLKFQGPASVEEFQHVLAGSCYPSIDDGFAISLPPGEKMIPATHEGPRSLVTLAVSPSALEIVESTRQPGRLKLNLTDSSGRRHRFLPVTDLCFHDYFQNQPAPESVRALNEEIAMQEQVFVRIGLSRVYKNPQGREGFWLQVNGIHTFPRNLSYIRAYSAKSAGEK